MKLRSEKLCREVGGKKLVDNISFELQQNEIVAIIGPSGAGKSSFLRLLNRLDEPTGGTVYLDERDYKTFLPAELRRTVGMVLQTPYLFAGTVAENLQFGPQQRGEVFSPEQQEQLLTQVGLAGYGSRDVAHLSGGEAQRISLARALANSPQILLLDEPTSALDDRSGREVEELLLETMQRRQISCLIITHNLEQARRVANRVLLLAAGGQKALGTPQEVLPYAKQFN